MRNYSIYDMNTDELIGMIKAYSVEDAERKACGVYNKGSLEIYALSE